MYYLDFPYVFTGKEHESEHRLKGMKYISHELDDISIKKWIDSISFYGSQISSFWESEGDMENSIREYYKNMGCIKLYF
jgi:hypothetical protein